MFGEIKLTFWVFFGIINIKTVTGNVFALFTDNVLFSCITVTFTDNVSFVRLQPFLTLVLSVILQPVPTMFLSNAAIFTKNVFLCDTTIFFL